MNSTPSDTSHQTLDGLRSVVFADLKGSTEFTERLGNDAGLAQMNEFEDAVREGLSDIALTNSGTLVKRVGDGILLAFEHFPDVVEWWIHFSSTLKFKVTGLESATIRPFQMTARVWVHVGDVSIGNGDVNGLCVSELSKIEKECKRFVPPGEVILTEITCLIARSTLYPPQCRLERLEPLPGNLGNEIKLFRLRVEGGDGMTFLLGKDAKAKLRAEAQKAAEPKRADI